MALRLLVALACVPAALHAVQSHSALAVAEGAHTQFLKPKGKTQQLKKKKHHAQETGATTSIDDINATGASLSKLAEDTMYGGLKSVTASLDTFSKSLKKVNSTALEAAKLDEGATSSVVAYVSSVAGLAVKAHDDLESDTLKRAVAMKLKLGTFRAFVEKVANNMKEATTAVDAAVNNSRVEQTVLLRHTTCCSSVTHKSRGIWDSIKNIFSSKDSSVCGVAQSSIKRANSSIGKLSEGLSVLNGSVSDLLHEWGEAATAKIQLFQNDAEKSAKAANGVTDSDIEAQVSDALHLVSDGLVEVNQSFLDADKMVTKSLKATKDLFQASYDAVKDLDLQATAACAAMAKKKDAGAPCDHHC